MTKKFAKAVATAKDRTRATPLADPSDGLLPDYTDLVPARLSRVGYVGVRPRVGSAYGAAGQGEEILDLARTWTHTRADTQHIIDERHRKDATYIRKGLIPAYSRVVRVEVREIPEETI